MKQLLILAACVALLASCRSSRAIGKAVGKKDSMAKAAAVVTSGTPAADTARFIKSTLEGIQRNHIAFTTFSAKVGVSYRGTDGKGHDVNVTMKMYKDSAIWVSVNAILGIEALRLLVTRDSVKLMNKLEKTYAARDISFLQEATSLPLDLFTLQDLIIGNPVYLNSNVVRYTRSAGVITLLSVGDLFRNAASFSAADTTMQHSKLTDADPFRARNADLTYDEYETKAGVHFATKRQIIVSERGRLEVKLDFKNYSFDEEVSFPFKVPKGYAKE